MAAALLDKARILQVNTHGPVGFPPGPLLCFVIFLVPIGISFEKTLFILSVDNQMQELWDGYKYMEN